MGRVTEALALGTRATGTVLAGVLFTNGPGRKYLISADLTWTWSEVTDGNGPIDVGVAHGDYSVTEISEWFNSASFSQSDKIEREENARGRFIKQAGTISATARGGATAATNAGQLANGAVKRLKLGFLIEDGGTVNIWARNADAVLLATGSILRASGKVWYRNA